MPRQKLNRKPPRLKGQLGQVQKPGQQDPEHQQGVDITEKDHSPRSKQPDNDIETDRPHRPAKENPI
ncbi:MAG TPA: hypothetical protein VFR18_07365 [Terriglobia bacterium]|nr:hypothetical protein [Terriglobia bacterium]